MDQIRGETMLMLADEMLVVVNVSYFLTSGLRLLGLTRVQLFGVTQPGGAKRCHMAAAASAADWSPR